MEILLGIAIGYLGARVLVSLLTQQNWTRNSVQEVLLAACMALGLVLAPQVWPYFSGYLAVMAMGFFLIELDAPLARRLRGGFDALWTVAEIVLFVLLGASLDLGVLGSVFWPGLLLLTLSLLLGRVLGLVAFHSGKQLERAGAAVFATGQHGQGDGAGGYWWDPFGPRDPGGEIILALAALSVLVTAPPWVLG
jgi:NhaP-type Na+/H+ or K+/H+ antiporter